MSEFVDINEKNTDVPSKGYISDHRWKEKIWMPNENICDMHLTPHTH